MLLSAPPPQIVPPLQCLPLARRCPFMAVSITPLINCLTNTILFYLHPHSPSSLSLSLLILTYRHSISSVPVVPHIRRHNFPPPSLPAFPFFRPHHTLSMASAVLVTSFSVIPVLFLSIFSHGPILCSALFVTCWLLWSNFIDPSCSNLCAMICYSWSTLLQSACSTPLRIVFHHLPSLRFNQLCSFPSALSAILCPLRILPALLALIWNDFLDWLSFYQLAQLFYVFCSSGTYNLS